MKLLFAYFTDVHGNIDALDAVIEDTHSCGADRFVCGGDMIGIGPFTNEVLERLFNTTSLQMITGNHDEAVLALKYGRPYPESHSHAKKHHQWIADQLDNQLAKKLITLPRELTFIEDHLRFLITHYPFKQGKKESPISEDPFMPIISEPNLNAIEELFNEESTFDFIGFGHHHILHNFKSERTHFVNPGALGCHALAEARYALVYANEKEIHVEFKSQLDVPESAFLMRAFHNY